jgi:2-keto-4-pentenoate hydratase/2-oxohepta-3-ene-1,7-dioic acid hydratase in catechol pathway
MKLAAYMWGGERHVGMVINEGRDIQPFALTREQANKGVLTLIEMQATGESLPALVGTRLPISAVQLDAPIPQPRRNLLCVGRNYRAHAKELSASVFKDNDANPESWPIVFTKMPETVIGPHDHVLIPTDVSSQIDYEAELTVVIGKGGRNISRVEALGHVYGYTIVNDVTARDVQMRHQQWDLGKSFDTFCPMGPWIVTADELDGMKSRVRCWVNGELRQDGDVTDMIFDIPTLIETCSRGITLYPGDVIATGSPAGVGMGFNPPRYLKAGDVVRIEVVGIGVIENKFV